MQNAECTMRKAWMMALGLLVVVTSMQAKVPYTVTCLDGSNVHKAIKMGVDTLYTFADMNSNKPTFQMPNDVWADWLDMTDPRIHSEKMSSFIDVTDGHCYRVVSGNDTSTFAVIDYSLHPWKMDSMKVTPACDKTTIVYPKHWAMRYFDASGKQQTAPYVLELRYMNQVWDSAAVDWKTQEIVDTMQIDGSGVKELPMNLIDTRLAINDSVHNLSDSTEIEAVAVDKHIVYYIAKRGQTMENEKEGPWGSGNLKLETVHSAPLNVLFESHPSDKADAYSWEIKRVNELVTQRQDKNIRYLFEAASETSIVTYTIGLEVVHAYMRDTVACTCSSKGEQTLSLGSSFIMVPNVFTPNDDNINDEFRVAYESICEFHCWVYNRWQHLVYSWDDPAKGWDGTYNGQKEPDGAFLWIIEAKGCDGRKYKLKGMVNLLRGK